MTARRPLHASVASFARAPPAGAGPAHPLRDPHRTAADAHARQRARDLLGLAGWIALALAPAVSGAAFGPDDWYHALVKPHWTPPSAVFAPVWAALYLLLGLAAWLVWRARAVPARARSRALLLFAILLVLDAAWTPLFFGLRQPGLAFADILLLWLAAVGTAFAFVRVREPAGWLLAPYIAWVSFALILNGSIWLLNR